MEKYVLVIAALYGALGIIFGAFGAHALKKILSDDLLKSFETGVKYQLYHAIVLLILGFNLDVSATINAYIINTFIIGTILFSFSIYGLVLSSANNKKLKFILITI